MTGLPAVPRLSLAPMAGITDRTMRTLCYRYGADYACTEMVSAVGWMCAKKDNPAYRLLLDTAPEEYNTAVQLFGKDPVVLAEAAARACEMGRFTSIDLNMGCPARKVTTSGEGSALLRTPDLAARIMETVKANSSLPVTVKTRLGYDTDSMNALALAQAAQGGVQGGYEQRAAIIVLQLCCGDVGQGAHRIHSKQTLSLAGPQLAAARSLAPTTDRRACRAPRPRRECR